MKCLKILFIFAFTLFTSIVFIDKVNAASSCYCCGGAGGCTYVWKEARDANGTNCVKVSKSKTACNGTNTTNGSGACWYCETGSTSGYRWTSDGSKPNANCYVVNGKTQSSCNGSSTGGGSGSGSTSDDETYEDYEDSDGPDISGPSTSSGCSGIIGNGQFRIYLTDILNAMRIVGVAMVIVFSTIDFAQALITQDNDAMKKASEKSMKRLILAMVIFFTPILLNILLSLVGIDASCI